MKSFRAVPLPRETADSLVRHLMGKKFEAFDLQDHTWMASFDGGYVVATESSWRLLDAAGVAATDHDHQQAFGLPAPFDAVRAVRDQLLGREVLHASVVSPTGDLQLDFGNGALLQWLVSSAGYESWRLTGPYVDLTCTGGGRTCTWEPIVPPSGSGAP